MLAHERSDLDTINGGLLARTAFQVFNLVECTPKSMKLKNQFTVLGNGGGAEGRNDVFNQLGHSNEVTNRKAERHAEVNVVKDG